IDANGPGVFLIRTWDQPRKRVCVWIRSRRLPLRISVHNGSQRWLRSGHRSTEGWAGNKSRLRNATKLLAKALIVRKEKGAILDDWAAEASTELIQLEYRNGRMLDRPACIEVIVAKVIEYAAVKGIRSCLRNKADLAASRAAGVRRISAGINLELGN